MLKTTRRVSNVTVGMHADENSPAKKTRKQVALASRYGPLDAVEFEY
jgi:hypothetical protein